MNEEQRYTLDEAEKELALRECRNHGHSWDVIEARTIGDPLAAPMAVVCNRCGQSHRVEDL